MNVRSSGLAGLLLTALLAACNGGSRSGENATASQQAALNAAPITVRVPWGDGPGELGFRPWRRESLPMGAPAVAVGKGGEVFVLDALHQRIVRVAEGGIVPVADVPRDADDLAIGPDGALAVLRQTKPEVVVFSPRGEKIGSVDVSAVREIDAISLGTSRRVMVTSPFQETFSAGSPSMPQVPGQILASKREGAFVAGKSGLATVRRDDGALELRVLEAGEERTETVATHSLGRGDAARLVGANATVACARIERVKQGADGVLDVEREVRCLDVKSGSTIFTTKLPQPGAYAPRHELAFAGTTLAFAWADGDGLSITTWKVEAAR